MTHNERLLTNVAKAEDVFNLAEHIGWTMVIKPELLRRKESLTEQLVNSMLGLPLPEGITKEMLAGEAKGIDTIIKLFENILTNGKKALEELNSKGIHIG